MIDLIDYPTADPNVLDLPECRWLADKFGNPPQGNCCSVRIATYVLYMSDPVFRAAAIEAYLTPSRAELIEAGGTKSGWLLDRIESALRVEREIKEVPDFSVVDWIDLSHLATYCGRSARAFVGENLPAIRAAYPDPDQLIRIGADSNDFFCAPSIACDFCVQNINEFRRKFLATLNIERFNPRIEQAEALREFYAAHNSGAKPCPA